MDAIPCAKVNMLARPYSSGEIKYVINGIVINPKKAPTMGPIENAPIFFYDITHELLLPIFTNTFWHIDLSKHAALTLFFYPYWHMMNPKQ